MRTFNFTLTGLTEQDLRSRRDRRLGRVTALLAVLASLFVLARPGMRLDPASHAFGEREVGTSQVGTFMLENPSSESLAVDVRLEGDINDFFVERSCTSIAPVDKCELAVRFTPVAPGPRVARVVVSDAGGRPSVGADLSGVGTSPPDKDDTDDGGGIEGGDEGGTESPPTLRSIAFDPPALVFDESRLGGQRARAAVRIINRSEETFPVTTRLSGSSLIRGLNESCASVTLPVGGNCKVELEFDPRAAGKHQAKLRVTDDRQAVHSMTISGSVTEPRPDGGIVFSPNPVAFKAQSIGAKVSQPVTLENTSDKSFKASYAPLDASIAGDFSLVGACEGFFFLPRSKCQGSVQFHPRSGGTRTGTASILNDAGAVVGTLRLEGAGQLAAMRVEPQQLDFTPPQPRDQSVTVFNEGDAPFVIGPVRMQSGDNAYFHDSPPCLSQPLASKERCTIPVHYNAGLTGTAQTHVADLLISPDSMPGARVRLTWTRPLEPAVSASPSSLSFGRVRLGAEATQDVTFTNTGGGAANNVVVGFMKDNTPFSVARNGCSSLPANSRCVVSVRFRPTGAGHANATLTFWNGLAMLTTVAVDGDGLPSPNDPVVQ